MTIVTLAGINPELLNDIVERSEPSIDINQSLGARTINPDSVKKEHPQQTAETNTTGIMSSATDTVQQLEYSENTAHLALTVMNLIAQEGGGPEALLTMPSVKTLLTTSREEGWKAVRLIENILKQDEHTNMEDAYAKVANFILKDASPQLAESIYKQTTNLQSVIENNDTAQQESLENLKQSAYNKAYSKIVSEDFQQTEQQILRCYSSDRQSYGPLLSKQYEYREQVFSAGSESSFLTKNQVRNTQKGMEAAINLEQLLDDPNSLGLLLASYATYSAEARGVMLATLEQRETLDDLFAIIETLPDEEQARWHEAIAPNKLPEGTKLTEDQQTLLAAYQQKIALWSSWEAE